TLSQHLQDTIARMIDQLRRHLGDDGLLVRNRALAADRYGVAGGFLWRCRSVRSTDETGQRMLPLLFQLPQARIALGDVSLDFRRLGIREMAVRKGDDRIRTWVGGRGWHVASPGSAFIPITAPPLPFLSRIRREVNTTHSSTRPAASSRSRRKTRVRAMYT